MLFQIERSDFPKKIRAMAASRKEAAELIDKMFGPAQTTFVTPIEEESYNDLRYRSSRLQ